MSTFGGVLSGGGESPLWLKTFQEGKPGDAGWYLTGDNLNLSRSRGVRRLYGPIKDEAHAWVLSSLQRSDEGAWPRPLKPQPYGRGTGLYDANELKDFMSDPGAYSEDRLNPLKRIDLLPVTKLKLGISESDALHNLRLIDFGSSGWWRVFRFEEEPKEGSLFPFAADEYTRRE